MPSLTEENYLKAIFTLNEEGIGATTNAIAKKMQTKASSVSDMLRRLKEKDLIDYKKYQSASLTAAGKKVAISIIRKHRLWEYFLVDVLKFGWDEVHEIAEQLEHIQSPQLTNRLEEFLGHPTADPHGDPIPDRDGKFPGKLSKTLKEGEKGESHIIIGVKNHSQEFLQYLDNLNINLGTSIQIKDINDFDHSMDIYINNDQVISVSEQVAKNLYIKIA